MTLIKQVCIGCGHDVFDRNTFCPEKKCRKLLSTLDTVSEAPKMLVDYITSQPLNVSVEDLSVYSLRLDLGKKKVKKLTVETASGIPMDLILAVEKQCQGILVPVSWEKGFAFFSYTSDEARAALGRRQELVQRVQQLEESNEELRAHLSRVRKQAVNWSTLSLVERLQLQLKWKREDAGSATVD